MTFTFQSDYMKKEKKLGTSDFSEHRKESTSAEYKEIQKELKRLGLRK